MLLVGFARCVWVAVIVESKNVEVFNRRSDLVPSARAHAARARKTKSRAKRQRGEKEDDRLGGRKKRRRCDGVGGVCEQDGSLPFEFRGLFPNQLRLRCWRGGTPTDRETVQCLPVALFHHISAGDSALVFRSINPSLLAAVCLAQCVHRACLPVYRSICVQPLGHHEEGIFKEVRER